MNPPISCSRSLARLVTVAALAIAPACDTVEDLDPSDLVDEDGDADEDLVEFRWSTPLANIDTMVTSLNAPANGQNPGCWDTSPSGSVRPFQQYPCHARNNQRWRFEAVAGGAFRIHSADDDDLCVDVPGFNFVSGQNLQLFPCNSGINQRWRVFTRPDGVSATIRPAATSSLCMDVENAVVTGQAALQIFTCKNTSSSGSKNQAWRFHDYLDDDTVGGCNGPVRVFSATPSVVVGAGGVANFPVTHHRPDTLCSADFDHELIQCPSGTDWIVTDRLNGTGSFKVRCFDTQF